MYVLESDELAFGVVCDECDGDQAVSVTLDAEDGVSFHVIHCLDCGYVRLVRTP